MKANTKKTDVRLMCTTAVFTALTCAVTMIIRIPIPLGYAQLGNCIILLGTFLFGPFVGAAAGGAGSALADLLGGYPIWCLPTLLIKSIFPLIMWFFIKGKRTKIHSHINPVTSLSSVRTFIGVFLSMAFMVIGYTLSGALLYGSMEAGLASAPGLIAEGIANGLAFYALAFLLMKSGITKFVPVKSFITPKISVKKKHHK